jgi:penicillin-binding protein 1A
MILKKIPWLKIWNGIRILARVMIASVLVAIMLTCLIVYGKVKPVFDKAKAISYTKMSSISAGTFINEHNTQIYDKDDNLIGEINIGNFEYATIDNISPYIKNGYIAVEDRNFLTHSGIDYKALFRASGALLRNKGEVTQGGSTITQQVLKNNVLNDLDSSWERKMVEFFLAPEFENSYTKDQIMEYYCNTNYYQNGCYGVESASQYYFGKSAKDLTLAEASGLCGISNNPSKYNPVTNLEAYKERREKVLGDMLECGYITEVQYNEANKDEVNLALVDKKREKESYQVSFAIHCATLREMQRQGFEFKYIFEDEEEYNQYKEEYNKVYKDVSDNIRNGGYQIYTSFDNTAQAKLQEYVDKEMSTYVEKAEDGRYTMQASATVVDNETGYVIAIVGGRGTEDEFNRAYQSYRQPGSCAKPILAYAPAFDTGRYYPSKKIKDEKSSIAPSNWDNVYRGKVSVREALERSINTPAFYVMQDLTPKACVEYIGKMKFSGLSYLDTYNGSMALGGFTYGTTTFEMAKAYGTLVNNGIYDDKDCIRSIQTMEDGNMVEVFNSNQAKAVQVYQKDTAYLMIDTLKGVLTQDYATGKGMEIPDVIAAGKTGTTNSNKDGWFCGITPKYSIAVWAGYDNPKPVVDMGGGKYPGAIYKDMMTYLMENYHNLDFTRPNTVEEYNIDNNGDMTSKNTGNKDLFSATLIQENELKQAEEKEKKKQLENEKVQKEQDYKEKLIRDELEELKNTEITDLNGYEQTVKKVEKLKSDVDELISSLTREQLNSLIDMTVAEIESQYSILKVEYETQLKKQEEEQEAEKQAKEEELHQNRVQIAESALVSLESWQTSSVDTTSLIDSASKAVNMCKGYDEYKMYKDRYDTVLLDIKVYKESQQMKQQQTQVTTESITIETTETSTQPTSNKANQQNTQQTSTQQSNQPVMN